MSTISNITKAALAAAFVFSGIVASAQSGMQTNQVTFQDGADDRAEFQWCCFDYTTGKDEFVLSFYEGIPKTVYFRSRSVDYYIKYNEQEWGSKSDKLVIPFSNQTKKFSDLGGSFSIANDAEVGYYDVSIEDVGNDQWSVSILRTVSQVDDISNQEYTGSEIKPEPMVLVGSLNLTKGTDYEYSYADNTNVGTAKVTVTFKGDYASQFGSVEKTFEIYAKTLTSSNVADIAAQSYIGSALTPIVICDGITLVKGTDYDITLPEGGCVNAGDYTVTITGKGNYKGTVEKTFTINPRVTISGALTLTEDQNGITAEIDGNYNESDVAYSLESDIENVSVTFNRTFTAGVTSTIVLPFDIEAGGYSGGDFYEFSDIDTKTWTATMSKVTSVTAHTPYLFVPSGESLTISQKVTLEAASSTTAATTAQNGWSFTGVYKKKVWGGDDGGNKDYCFAANSTSGGVNPGDFVKIGTNVQVRAFRCYLTNSTLAKAKTDLPEKITIRLIDETSSVVNPDAPDPLNPDNSGDIATPVSEITPNSGVKVWSYDRTIFIEAQTGTDYQIIDLSGRTLLRGATNSTREEIALNRTVGIVIVKIGGKTFKVNY